MPRIRSRSESTGVCSSVSWIIQPAADADAQAQIKEEIDGKGGDPQAAGLDQQQNHHLAEEGKTGAGVDHRQAGDALGAGGGEQGIEKGERWPVGRRSAATAEPRR